MVNPEQKVLILKTGGTIPVIAQEMGDFEEWISAAMSLPLDHIQTVSIFEGELLPSIQEINSIIITGSPAMVTEALDWIQQSEKFIVSAIAAGIPVLGICFGHQLLAQALGGKVGWHAKGREIGTTEVSLSEVSTDDPMFQNLPETFAVHTSHMQTVTQLPAGATVIAANDFEANHGVRFADCAWGVQFHPEFDEQVMRRYIQERTKQIDEEGLNTEQLLAEVKTTPEALQLLKNFAGFCQK